MQTLSMLPPNESRLSCGARLRCSQTEFYHTACSLFSGLFEDGRRQLQALVRLPLTTKLAARDDAPTL